MPDEFKQKKQNIVDANKGVIKEAFVRTKPISENPALDDAVAYLKKTYKEEMDIFTNEALKIVNDAYTKVNAYYEHERKEFKREITKHVENEVKENKENTQRITEQLNLIENIKSEYEKLKEENKKSEEHQLNLKEMIKKLESLVAEKDNIINMINTIIKENEEFKVKIKTGYEKTLKDVNYNLDNLDEIKNDLKKLFRE